MSEETQPKKNHSKGAFRSIFSEISQNDLKVLNSYSEVKRLAAGEYLLREGAPAETVYVILEGELEIVRDHNGQKEKIGGLFKGDWFGEIAFTQKTMFTISAVSKTPVKAMCITATTLGALSIQSQIFFLKKLNDMAGDHIRRIQANEKRLNRLNQQLLQHFHFKLTQGNIKYSESKIITSIIKKVPRLPSFANTLIVKLAQKNASMAEAAELVKQDPSSVAIVLKSVNSAYYGFKQKITNINHALVLMGFTKTYQLLISDGLRRTMPNNPSFNEIQTHCVAISHIAFALSLALKVCNPTEMATIGLLHDLGRSLILLLKKQNPSMDIVIASLDHAQLGALLLTDWGMPDTFVRTFQFQSYPKHLPPQMVPVEIQKRIAVLYLAHLCLDIFQGKAAETFENMFTAEYMNILGCGQQDLIQIIQKKLLPSMLRTSAGYPLPFKRLLQTYLARECRP